MSTSVDIAYAFLKERILKGTYRPSQKLTEVQLAEEIGVSRNTVIKALLKLEQENLVTIEKNKGATIKSFTLPEVLNYLDIRIVLEGLAIRSAVSHIGKGEIERLGEVLSRMKSSLENGQFDEYSKLNKDFHEILYEASLNQPAVDLIRMIKTQLGRLHLRTILIPGRNHDSYQEHEQICQAVANRDEEAAAQAIMTHVQHIRAVIEANYNLLI